MDSLIVTHTDGSRQSRAFFTSICLRVSLFFRTIAQQPMQLRSPSLAQTCSKMSRVNPFFGIKRSKVKVKSHKNIAGVGLCTLVSYECWLLIIH